MKRCNVLIIEYTIRELERLVRWIWSPAFVADRKFRLEYAELFETEAILWHRIAVALPPHNPRWMTRS